METKNTILLPLYIIEELDEELLLDTVASSNPVTSLLLTPESTENFEVRQAIFEDIRDKIRNFLTTFITLDVDDLAYQEPANKLINYLKTQYPEICLEWGRFRKYAAVEDRHLGKTMALDYTFPDDNYGYYIEVWVNKTKLGDFGSYGEIENDINDEISILNENGEVVDKRNRNFSKDFILIRKIP